MHFSLLHVYGAEAELARRLPGIELSDGTPLTVAYQGALPPVAPSGDEADALLLFGCPAWCGQWPTDGAPLVVVHQPDASLPSTVFEAVPPGQPEALLQALRRALEHGRLRRDLRQARTRWQEVDARFSALAGSIPGLMFQMQWQGGRMRFLFSSGASRQLLGVAPEVLMQDGSCFLEMLAAEDRSDFEAALQASAHPGGQINWEGRVCFSEEDVKWINVRGSTRALSDSDLVWEGVMLNITRGKRAELQLRESRRQLAALSNHLQYAKEDERERIAREVHDLLGGHLVALKFETSFLNAHSHEAPQVQRLQNIGRLIDEAIETVGRVTRELRPGILRDFGLPAAIECQAEDFSQRTGIKCHVTCDDDFPELEEMVAISLFRIFQEALTNIMKHASASTVDVTLSVRDGLLTLLVNDNGSGIHSEDLDKPRSFGLRGMKERIASLGGSVDISRVGVRGTRLEVSLPLSGDVPEA